MRLTNGKTAETMKKHIILTLMAMAMALTASAQRIPSRIELKNNSIVTFAKEAVDSTRELPDVGIKIYPANGGGQSRDFLYSQIQNIEFYETKPTGENANRNTAAGAHLLEYPHLKEGSDQLLVVHSTQQYGITYSIEYDCSKKSQRWTAYEFHNGLPNNNVGRNDNFIPDPDIPSQYQTTSKDYSGSGYTRGHMCPSMDRQSSVEQNQQTFYMSNMHPQLSGHNSGIWNNLEQKVNAWGNNASFRDTLYVVKAGTIDNPDQVTGKTSSGLIIPKYFYMTILCLKDGQYKAIAFWTEHTNSTSATMSSSAITVRELEKRTGIDFFCNLPDDIEEAVETKLNKNDWGL